MNCSTKLVVLLLLAFLGGSQSIAQPYSGISREQGIVVSEVPRSANPKALYLFYLSGYIVEAVNRRPTSPKFGVYEYDQILDTFKQRGFVVISEARKKDPEIAAYAGKVADQVRQLLKAGVPPENITVVGASQGSFIAMLASTYLENRKLNFVLIAGCAADDGLLRLVNLHGNVLFISERSDQPGSCERFRSDATGLARYKLVETNTGQRHGFLYRPMKEWLEPTIAWARRQSIVVGSLEQELMQLQRTVDEAETRRDLATLDRLLSDNYVFTAPNGAISDKRQLMDDIKNAKPEADQTINYDEVRVYPYEDTAVVNYLLIVKGQDPAGKAFTNRYRNTVIWVKQQRHWRMAGIHVSRLRSS